VLKKNSPLESLAPLGEIVEKTPFSRRGLLIGISAASAIAALARPAKAAVSMLRTGVDPDQVAAESDVEEVGRRRRRWRGRRWRGGPAETLAWAGLAQTGLAQTA
jgi:hypothetical protein